MQKNLRARRFGITFASIGIVLALAGWLTESELGAQSLAQVDLALMVGCGLSLALTFTPLARGTYFWWPAYLVYWLASFPILRITGGLASPYLNEMLTILFGTGVLVQTRFSVRIVSYFVLANLLFWIGDAFLITSAGKMNQELLLLSIRSVIFLATTFLVISYLLGSEESLAKEKELRLHELDQARQELAHSARMAELGGVMATTAHELAQPVQVITMSTGLMRRMTEQDGREMPEECKILIHRLTDASRQISGVLTQLRDFSRKDSFQLTLIDLREAASRVALMCSYDLKIRGIQLREDLGNAPVWASVDPLRVQQVLFNLINNSRDAITTAVEPRIELRITRARDRARISIWNNGSAIPLEVQQRLFQPLFTTKRKGEGTGIGLTVCAQIAEQHGGKMLFHSSPEFGTEFVFEVPAAPERPGMLAVNEPGETEQPESLKTTSS